MLAKCAYVLNMKYKQKALIQYNQAINNTTIKKIKDLGLQS